MSRTRKIAVAALNVRAHPHTEDIYRSIFSEAFDLKKHVFVTGDTVIMLTSLSSNSEGQFFGFLARFTNIEMDEPWFDTKTLTTASEKDLDKVIIPDNLRPNYKPFRYTFDPKNHLFFIQKYGSYGGLSVNYARKFLDSLLNSPSLSKKYGLVQVDPVQSVDGIDEISVLSRIKELAIEIGVPNSDSIRRRKEQIEKRLEQSNAKRELIIAQERNPDGLVFDGDYRELATIALENGSIKAKGFDRDGNAVHRSSLDHPLIYPDKYDPERLSEDGAFNAAVQKLGQKIETQYSQLNEQNKTEER